MDDFYTPYDVYRHSMVVIMMTITVLVGTPLEGEHLHPYTLGTVSEDKCHGKKQIYTRAKDPDCTGVNQNRYKHGRTVPQA